jgi:hypothetical protein
MKQLHSHDRRDKSHLGRRSPWYRSLGSDLVSAAAPRESSQETEAAAKPQATAVPRP